MQKKQTKPTVSLSKKQLIAITKKNLTGFFNATNTKSREKYKRMQDGLVKKYDLNNLFDQEDMKVLEEHKASLVAALKGGQHE